MTAGQLLTTMGLGFSIDADLNSFPRLAWERGEFTSRWRLVLETPLPGVHHGGAGGIALAVILLVAWGLTGLYRVDEAERGVVQRFGAYTKLTNPGLHWHLPFPIETVDLVNANAVSNYAYDTEMLTADEQYVFIDMVVQYRRADPVKYSFEVVEPDLTLQDVTESALRGVVGTSTLASLIGERREEIPARVRRMRDIVERAATAWDEEAPDFAHFQAVRAFSNEEAGDYETAERAVRELEGRCVVKADGLAAGKGVIICQTVEEAEEAVKMIMVDRVFGDAGERQDENDERRQRPVGFREGSDRLDDLVHGGQALQRFLRSRFSSFSISSPSIAPRAICPGVRRSEAARSVERAALASLTPIASSAHVNSPLRFL